MRAKVQKWGNSLAIRIPKAYAEEMALHAASDVEIMVKEGKLVIAPRNQDRITLDDLLDGLDPNTIHEEIDMGPPSGNEFR